MGLDKQQEGMLALHMDGKKANVSNADEIFTSSSQLAAMEKTTNMDTTLDFADYQRGGQKKQQAYNSLMSTGFRLKNQEP